MRILVDTNVFLDYLLNRNTDAGLFFHWCAENKNQIFVTSMSLRDIEYTTHRLVHNKKASKFIQMQAYQICSKVIGISADAAIESLYSDVDDYEDSLIIEAAKEEMLDVIVSNNKKDFTKSGFPIFTPTEMLSLTNIN